MQGDLTRPRNRFFDFSRLLGNKDTPLVASVRSVMAQSGLNDLMPLLSPFLTEIDNHWQVRFEYLDHYGYDIDEDGKFLTLSTYGLMPEQALKSPYFSPQIILSLVESLRMARHIEWLDGSLERYHPESIMRIGRICMADTATQLVAFAWATREAGHKDIWKTLLCGDYADMAAEYQNVMEQQSPETDMTVLRGVALARTFKQWFFGHDRVTECDHNTLDLIDAMLVDQKMPGNDYLEPTAITCLTLRGGGVSSYIDTAMRSDIMDNPLYSAVTDPINQAHLMQIIHDMYTVSIGSVAFRDTELAARFTALQ